MFQRMLAVKRYGNGKFTLYVDCPEENEKAVTDAMLTCADLRVDFNRKAFRSLLYARGLPREVVEPAVDSLRVDDETFASNNWPT